MEDGVQAMVVAQGLVISADKDIAISGLAVDQTRLYCVYSVMQLEVWKLSTWELLSDTKFDIKFCFSVECLAMYGSSLLCGGSFYNVETRLTTDLVLVLDVSTLEIKHELPLDHPGAGLRIGTW